MKKAFEISFCIFSALAFIVVICISISFIRMGLHFKKLDVDPDYMVFSTEGLEIDVSWDTESDNYYPYIMLYNGPFDGRWEIVDRTYLWCEKDNKAYFIGYENRYILFDYDNKTEYVSSNDLSVFSAEDRNVFSIMEKQDDLFLTSEYIQECFDAKGYYDDKGQLKWDDALIRDNGTVLPSPK